MINFILNENTVAIKKQYNKTIIYNVENFKVFNKSINRILDDNCLINGSSLKARKKYAKKVLNIEYKVPLIINENNNLILLQINSIRKKDCLYIVLNKIIDYSMENGYLKIKCINNNYFYVNLSIYSLEKMIVNATKLLNYFNAKKLNFV